MSTAGGSAAHEAERSRALVDAHLAAAEMERQRVENFMIAAVTEKRTAAALAPLRGPVYAAIKTRMYAGTLHALTTHGA